MVMRVEDKERWRTKYQAAQSEIGKDGKLEEVYISKSGMSIISTAYALKNRSMNSVFLTLCLHTNSG